MPRILLVEDDRDFIEALVSLLESTGYQVASAQNGQEALEVLRASSFDLILLDLLMPVMDGWQFVRHLRRAGTCAAPIVVLSASRDVDGEAQRLGAQGFLSKPFHLDQLLAEIERLTRPEQPRA